MRDATALMTALTMMRRPSFSRTVRSAPLPNGVTFLLEVAAGDADALDEARDITGEPQEKLVDAASFFVEQVMLARTANSYRVLGGSSDQSTAELRRHMALLMKWLHPDTAAAATREGRIDRTVFAPRVVQAWDDLKSAKSRAAYDATQAKGTRWPRRPSASASSRAKRGSSAGRMARPGLPARRPIRAELYAALRDWFWSRWLRYFPGGQ
jgi:hypothetical protein